MSLRSDLSIGAYQNGVVGETGREWTVRRSGQVLRQDADVKAARAPAPVASIAGNDLSRLAAQFEQADWRELPATLGRGPMVNGARLRLTYAGHTVEMRMPAGTTEPEGLQTLIERSEDSREKAFLQLAQAVLALVPR